MSQMVEGISPWERMHMAYLRLHSSWDFGSTCFCIGPTSCNYVLSSLERNPKLEWYSASPVQIGLHLGPWLSTCFPYRSNRYLSGLMSFLLLRLPIHTHKKNFKTINLVHCLNLQGDLHQQITFFSFKYIWFLTKVESWLIIKLI